MTPQRSIANPFILILQLKLRLAWRTMSRQGVANVVRTLSYLGVVLFFLIGGFLFFRYIFDYLASIPPIGPALAQRIIETAFVVFLAMLFLSSVITSLSTFYRSREVDFLMSKPISMDTIFSSKLVDGILYSSWATVLAGVPIMMAFGSVQRASFIFYPVAVAVLIGFVLIPTGIGVTVLITVARFFPRLRRSHVRVLSIFIVILAVAIGIWATKPGGFRLPTTANVEELDAYLAELVSLSSPFLPSTWVVQALDAATSDRLGESFFLVFVLWSSGMAAIVITLVTASGLYRQGWHSSTEASTKARRRPIRRFWALNTAPAWRAPIALVEKDIKVFTRDPTQWAQAVILIALLGIYVASLSRQTVYLQNVFWHTVIAFTNLAFTGYVLATLSIRFVFPSISLEGATYWVLRSSPLSMRRLVLGKLAISFAAWVVLAETLVVVSNLILGTGPVITVVAAGAVLFVTLAVVCISIGLGAVLPDFKERNPSKIASGPGGILAAVISLFYVGITVSILAWPTHLLLAGSIDGRPIPLAVLLGSGLAFVLVNAIAIALPLRWGMRALNRREI